MRPFVPVYSYFSSTSSFTPTSSPPTVKPVFSSFSSFYPSKPVFPYTPWQPPLSPLSSLFSTPSPPSFNIVFRPFSWIVFPVFLPSTGQISVAFWPKAWPSCTPLQSFSAPINSPARSPSPRHCSRNHSVCVGYHLSYCHSIQCMQLLLPQLSHLATVSS